MFSVKSDRTAVELPDHKLVFFAAPKVASSSIKKMLYQVQTGEEFPERHPDGSKTRIHGDFSPTVKFLDVGHGKYKKWAKITLVRDPVERIISAYANKVVNLGVLKEKHTAPEVLEKFGLHPAPSLGYFARNIDKYRLVSRSVNHHTAPLTAFLGHDLGYFDVVFKFDQLPMLVDFLSDHTGTEAILPPATNKTKPGETFRDIGVQARKSLLNHCAGDYALLRDFYTPRSFRGEK